VQILRLVWKNTAVLPNSLFMYTFGNPLKLGINHYLRRRRLVNITTSFIANNRRILIEELFTFSCDDGALLDNRTLNPLTPELNPSGQRCLTRYFAWGFSS
jgi:hypothetical protein